MTTVALYARVSSRKQAQNNTIGSQIAELEHRIAADGYKLLDEYKFEDDGRSGWNLKREGLEELRDKVAEGQIGKIYIHSPDRLSRKSVHQMVLLEEFEKAGVEVIFLNHKTENNPESKLLLGVQGLISEYECTKIMERSRRGKLHTARKGCISVMGNAPYGYRYIKHVVREEAKFEINEEEAKIVSKLFEWIGQERMSLKRESFDIVQEQLLENRKRARMQRSGRKYLLQGLMVCQYCKYTYYGMSNIKGGRSYYRCPGTDANRFGGNKVCNSRSIRADILEKAVWEEVKMVLKDPDKVAKEHQLRLLEHKNKQPNDEFEKEISKLEQGIKRLAYVYARGHITQEEYDLEAEAMEKKLKGMRNQKEEMVDEKRLQRELDFTISSVKDFASGVELELDQADWETKLDIVRKLVGRIEIDSDNVDVVFRLKELALEKQKKMFNIVSGFQCQALG